MPEYIDPTNELIEQLISKLSPEGRDAWEEINRARAASARVEAAEAEALVERLSESDKDTLLRLLALKYRALEVQTDQAVEVGQGILQVLRRAAELLRAEGKEPDPKMTLREAAVVLQQHGEGPPPPPR